MTGAPGGTSHGYAPGERHGAVQMLAQAGETAVDNCGYSGGYSRITCGRPVGTAGVVTRRPEMYPPSSTTSPQPLLTADLRIQGLSTLSTGANNPMESLASSQSTKGCGGQTWGQLGFAPLPMVSVAARKRDLSGCPQAPTRAGVAAIANRLVTTARHAPHLPVTGSAWHAAESGGTQR
jgi:hypothetical protein